MKSELERIAESYLTAKKEVFTHNPVAKLIREEARKAVRLALGSDGEALLFKGSAGMSQWMDSPWIGVLDPLVTTTAQRGYYVVYLFSASMRRLVLSLNQGITEHRAELPVAEAKERLKHRAGLIRLTLPECKESGFSTDPIALEPPNSGSRAAFYEAGHAFGKTYSFPLPDEMILVEDLRQIVSNYRLLTFRGGPDANLQGLDLPSDEDALKALEERRRYRLHRRIERNPMLVKKAKGVHGLCGKVCGFTFRAVYGETAGQYIEAHHLVPISSLPKDKPIMLDPKADFTVLCANCHRIVHSVSPPIDPDELRRIILSSTTGQSLMKLFSTSQAAEQT